MQEYTANRISEVKRLIKWIGQNQSMWDTICGRHYDRTAYFDQIEILKDLQENEFYSLILTFISNPQYEIHYIAMTAIIEEVLETWHKEQWDEVIAKIIRELEKSHQEAKRQRAELAEKQQAKIKSE